MTSSLDEITLPPALNAYDMLLNNIECCYDICCYTDMIHRSLSKFGAVVGRLVVGAPVFVIELRCHVTNNNNNRLTVLFEDFYKIIFWKDESKAITVEIEYISENKRDWVNIGLNEFDLSIIYQLEDKFELCLMDKVPESYFI
jgi:hypothetical protein